MPTPSDQQIKDILDALPPSHDPTQPFPGTNLKLESGFFRHDGSYHGAADWKGPAGTPVPAETVGTYNFNPRSTGYGMSVTVTQTLSDESRVTVTYGHIVGDPKLNGTTVSVGQILGYVGSREQLVSQHGTLNANYSGTHLHEQIEVNFKDENGKLTTVRIDPLDTTSLNKLPASVLNYLEEQGILSQGKINWDAALKSTPPSFLDQLTTAATNIVGGVIAGVGAIVGAAAQVVGGVLGVGVQAVGSVIGGLTDAAKAVGGFLGSLFGLAPPSVPPETLAPTVTAPAPPQIAQPDVLAQLAQTAVTTIGDVVNAVGNVVSAVGQAIGDCGASLSDASNRCLSRLLAKCAADHRRRFPL
jgi:uncharacterized protein (DUF433 family)